MLRALSLSMLLVASSAGCAATAATEQGDPGQGEDALTTLGPEAYRVYADLAKDGGAAPSPGSVTVLGLRGLTIDGASHATKYGHAFDDTLVVLRADGVSVVRFAASTHPFERHGGAGVPDVNGDGVPDVSIIRAGVYDVGGRDRTIAGAPSYAVTQHDQGRIPGWRDLDHDGLISDAERQRSENRGDALTDVLFHQGEGAGAPPAVGCQVLPAAAMNAFTTAVGGGHARFRYVLVDRTGRDASKLPR